MGAIDAASTTKERTLRVVVFTHSLVSDWNHGNAHFLRGVMRELQRRGHVAIAYEPRDGWSRANLLRDHGEASLRRFHARFPELRSELYDRNDFDADRLLDGADVVLVHEWNEPWLIEALESAIVSLRGGIFCYFTTPIIARSPRRTSWSGWTSPDSMASFASAR